MYGQNSAYYLEVEITDFPEDKSLADKWSDRKLDSLSIRQELNRTIQQLQAASFLEASVDSISFIDSTATAHIHRGATYKFADIAIDEKFISILAQAGYRTENMSGKAVDMVFISEMFDNVVEQLENNGFPFANISFKNYTANKSQFKGELSIDKGRFITMDTFNFYGLNLINKNYLYNYLQIKPGDTYNASEILKIKTRLNNLPFLELSSDPTIRFMGNKAILNLKMREKNASRFDFIVGVLPNSDQERRFTISGEVNFEVQNKLKQGEQLAVKFESLKPETQKLDFNFKYPYLLSLPFGFDTEFNLFRNENKNRDLNFSFGVLYRLKTNNFLKAFWNTQSSRLIEIDTTSILRSGTLPSRLDVSTNNFGIESNWQNLDYIFNPRKGYQVILRGTAGQKRILPSNNILSLQSEEVDFSKAFDSLDLSTYQFKIDLNARLFLPIMKRSTILTSVRLSQIISEEKVYENEYVRIGGNNLLRGFDEESIAAEFYTVGTLEYRLLISRNSFIAGFIDYGFRQNKFDNEFEWDQPYGFGAGFSLETGAGIFGINVAVGSQKGNPLDFENVKTHMGFLGLF